MLHILLVSRNTTSISALKAGFEENGVQTAWAESGSHALSMIAERSFDLVVTNEELGDMTGLEFIKTLIAQKPMVNCAVVSSLLPEDFHEDSVECRCDISGGLIKIELLGVKLSNTQKQKTVRSNGITSHSFERA